MQTVDSVPLIARAPFVVDASLSVYLSASLLGYT